MYTKHRQSTQINRNTAQYIFDAFDYVESIGTAFNYLVVIHLNGSISKSNGSIVQDILNRFRRWLRRKSVKSGLAVQPTYAWTRENPDNNEHLNLVVYIPDAFKQEFEKKIFAWVKKSQGPYTEFTVNVQPITKHYKSVANYILKGVDPEYIKHFHLNELFERHGPQGQIFGKRAGYSIRHGRTAIKSVGFSPRQHRRKRLKRAA